MKASDIFDDSSNRDRQGRLWRPTYHRPSRVAQSRHVHRRDRTEHQFTPAQRCPSRRLVYPADTAHKTRNIQFTGLVSAGRVLVWATREGPGRTPGLAIGQPVRRLGACKYSEIVWLCAARIASTRHDAMVITGLPNTYPAPAARAGPEGLHSQPVLHNAPSGQVQDSLAERHRGYREPGRDDKLSYPALYCQCADN
jgi:hypothetical protein